MRALTEEDLVFLRSLPSSTEPPIGGTREQRQRADDLPWGLLREGRRTELGDFVVEQAARVAKAKQTIERLRAERADLLAHVEGIDLAQVLAHAEEILSLHGRKRTLNESARLIGLTSANATAAAVLVRVIAGLRAESAALAHVVEQRDEMLRGAELEIGTLRVWRTRRAADLQAIAHATEINEQLQGKVQRLQADLAALIAPVNGAGDLDVLATLKCQDPRHDDAWCPTCEEHPVIRALALEVARLRRALSAAANGAGSVADPVDPEATASEVPAGSENATVVRGHLAAPDSPAEAALWKWSEFCDATADPEVLRTALAKVETTIAELKNKKNRVRLPYQNFLRQQYQHDIPIAEARQAEAVGLLKLAQQAQGYLGEDR